VLTNAESVAFVACLDLDEARAFYGDVLRLEVVETTAYAVVVRSGGRTIRVTLVESFAPQGFTVLGWVVPDIGESLRDLVAAGVEPVRYDGMDQDAAGAWHTPSGDAVAWFRDPSGNVLSLTQWGT